MNKKVVIVVDAQVDFIKEGANLPVPGAEPLIKPINDYLKSLTKEDTHLVLYSFDTHVPEVYAESEEGKIFPPHCVKGTEGWELAVTTDIEPLVYKLEKGVFDMWQEEKVTITDAEGHKCSREFFFAHLKRDELFDFEVVGFAADFCVKWAVDGLVKNGFRVKVKKDLTKGIERQIEQVYSEEWVNKRVVLG